ncbi:Hint domain-containing protein [Vannielia sp. SX4]|uniref:Hint domain-containing protein n=1 Tax=Vannielia sp. SX4 TaxID=3463852 RepID=UPI0040597490
MAIGYRVNLGNGTLNNGDAIQSGMEAFSIDETIGTGQWRWSGTYTGNNNNYTNITDTGTYYLGTDGFVYFVPNNYFVDPVFSATATSAPTYTPAAPGPVDGTAGNDLIDGQYEDAQGDEIDGNGNTINAGGGNDTVVAGSGNDVIDGGTGADTIYAGGGADTIVGGDGNDVIHADNASVSATSETLDWTDQGGDTTDISGGFTQNTGTMNVTVSIADDGGLTAAEVSTDQQYVNTGAGETFDTNSALYLGGAGSSLSSFANTATVTIDFDAAAGSGMANEVSNATFRINDLDQGGWDDLVTVVAYDAQGNEVPVTFQLDGDDSMYDADTIDGAGSGSAAQSNGSALITVEGPVAQIIVTYQNGGSSGQALWLTDVQFTTIPDDGGFNDTVSGGAGDDTIYGYGGDDTLDGGANNDTIHGGDGDDQIRGGTGDDTLTGGAGDDDFIVENGFGNDTITGGETGESFGDSIDASAVTDDLTVTFTSPESGTLGDGTATTGFSEIETVTLGSGDDTVTGSTGDDYIETGAGADTAQMGAGNDTVALGAADGAVDTVVMGDGDGNDTVFDFEAPTANGDGTYTGNDQLDVSDMTDAGGDPVSVHDVAVSDDGFGSAVLTFPNGESVTLVGVSAAEAADPMWLIAAGIPGDGIVSGTAGNDVIDAGYTGDPHGDMVDNGDAILPGESGDDDIIEAGAGDDTIYAGAGDDEVYGEAGDDTVMLEDGFGADTITGGETGETNGDTVNASLVSGDQTVVFSGAEAGTLTDGTDTASFSEIENVVTGAGNDTVTGDAGEQTVFTGAGDDSIALGTGADTIFAGAGDDLITLGEAFGNDQITGGEGGETAGDLLDAGGMTSGVNVTFSGDESGTVTQGGNTASFSEIERVVTGSGGDSVNATAATGGVNVATGAGDDNIALGSGDDTLAAGTGNDFVSVFDGFGNDSLLGGEGGESLVFGGLLVGDVLLANGVTSDVTLTFSGPEAGTISDGTDTLSFAEFESITLGSGNDTVTGSAGADLFDTGAGTDTVNAGAGDDTYGLGTTGDFATPDGAADTIIFADGDGEDTVYFFDAPTANGDGTYTGIDQIDVSGMTDADGNPVTVQDVVVSDDGSGNAVLGFPNGESLTLMGIAPTAAMDPFWLIAAGIPYDGIVEGTSGDDVIDASYSGDPHSDVIDGFDNFNDPMTGLNSDIVHAGDGDDVINAGEGDDLVLGEGGDDTFQISGYFDQDNFIGGETGETNGDTLDTTAIGAGSMSITYSGDEAGSLSHPDGGVDFSEIENITTGGTDDLIDATATTGGINVSTGAGDDGVRGGSGDDVVDTGEGNDNFVITDGWGTDSFNAGEDAGGGDQDILWADAVTADLTLDLSASPEDGTLTDGTNTVTFTGVESYVLGSGDDTVIGSDSTETTVFLGAGADTIDAGAGDDAYHLGADGDADTLIFADGDGSDYVLGFDAPTDNGDGTFTGVDQIDVSGMTDAGGDPVSVHDVVVTDDGSGNAVLSFPGGESLTLVGISPADAAQPMWLIAAGIPGDGIVSGTAGDDVIDGSYASDPHGDFVDAGDAILPGEAANDDIIEAGAGDDTIYAGAGDDEVYGEDGDDRFVLEDGFGADVITGGEGGETTGDTLDTTPVTGDVTITLTGAEAGTVTDGTDTSNFSEIENFETGAGADTIDGAAATTGFTANTGAGDDVLIGGDGADTLLGGDDADTFYAGDGDHVQGGEGGVDADVLDLTSAGPTRVIYDESDPESGTVEFLDGTGNVTGTMTFSEIETVNFIPCFTPGTMIATPEGPRPVEELGPGDRVLTRDHGVKRLQWVGQRLLNEHHLKANPRLMPVLIKTGALGYGLPERDIMVSPQHKMLISDARAEMLFGEHEVLVSAVHLVGLPGIEQVQVEEVIYIHIMFDAHEIIMAEGAWTESYQPGAHVLGEMEDEQREEIFEIFPELRADANSIVTARMALKKREVTALFH